MSRRKTARGKCYSIQERHDNHLDHDRPPGSGDREKWLDLRFTLDIESTRLANELDEEGEKTEGTELLT